jgi:hypothetical protein
MRPMRGSRSRKKPMRTAVQFWRRWRVEEDEHGQGETHRADMGSCKERPKLDEELRAA